MHNLSSYHLKVFAYHVCRYLSLGNGMDSGLQLWSQSMITKVMVHKKRVDQRKYKCPEDRSFTNNGTGSNRRNTRAKRMKHKWKMQENNQGIKGVIREGKACQTRKQGSGSGISRIYEEQTVQKGKVCQTTHLKS